MTPEEAMTDLSIQREVKKRFGKIREAGAIGLGIEALKGIMAIRCGAISNLNSLLPGETEK